MSSRPPEGASRAPRRARHKSVSKAVLRRRRIVAGAALGALVACGLGLGLGLTGSPTPRKRDHPAVKPHVTVARCPLTDLRAPGGHVPQRPAVGVKIGNEPEGARPQSGLNEADIVYDTPAEGFIMRYLAVFQCYKAAHIGPVRSVRWVDWHILPPFGQPILAYAGGINPDMKTVSSLGWLKPANLLGPQSSAGTRITSRVPPDNLYTSTSALLALYPSDRKPPPPVFHYGKSLPPGARRASSLAIDFSPGTDVLWKWDAAASQWLHTYSGKRDVDALTGKPVTTTNIVVQIVHYHFGPYPESPGSTGDVESQTVGSGQGYVLRGGRSIAVTWHRQSLQSETTFTDHQGRQVTLAPGRTWVEIVPNTVASSIRITR